MDESHIKQLANPTMSVRERLELRALEAVFSGTTWLTEVEVDANVTSGVAGARSPVAGWVQEGKLFAIESDGLKLFPRYAFDALGAPITAVREVVEIFEGYSSLQLAAWFESTSSTLGGLRPRELLARDPLAVVTCARAHKDEPMHG